MTLPSIDHLTPDKLRALISRASTRLEEHERIHAIPEQVGALARDYCDGGGDPAVLVNTITQATQEPLSEPRLGRGRSVDGSA